MVSQAKNSPTKDKVLTVALDLFSQRGYEGTSVDSIAEAVGIKAPSLYKHFKGKNQILEDLIEKVEIYYKANFDLSNATNLPLCSAQDLMKMIFDKIQFTMEDPIIRKSRMFLTQEQFRNSAIAELATKHNITGIQKKLKELFKLMMNAHILKSGDAEITAFEFAAPISLMVQLYDRHPEKKKKIFKIIKQHMNHFLATYGV